MSSDCNVFPLFLFGKWVLFVSSLESDEGLQFLQCMFGSELELSVMV